MIEISDEVKAWLTREQTATLWGQPHTIEPYFVTNHLGDGNQLLAVSPINERPAYYLIRVDSKWSERHTDNENCISEHIDEICEAIEDEVGPRWCEDDDGNEVDLGWPGLNDDGGTAWWEAGYLLREAGNLVAKAGAK